MKELFDFIGKMGFIPTIMLDDGHFYIPETGDATPGKRTPPLPDTGKVIYENQFNRAVIDKLDKRAKELGFNTFQTAPEAGYVALETRTKRANDMFEELIKTYPKTPSKQLAIIISIHYNAFKGIWDQCKGGITTYYYGPNPKGKELAADVQNSLVQGTPQENRGIKDGSDLWIIKVTRMVAILVECGFMDVLKEAVLMLNDKFQNEVVEEILQGVCKFYGVPYEAPKAIITDYENEVIRVYADDIQIAAYTGYSKCLFVAKTDERCIGKHVILQCKSDGKKWDLGIIETPESTRIKELEENIKLVQTQLEAAKGRLIQIRDISSVAI